MSARLSAGTPAADPRRAGRRRVAALAVVVALCLALGVGYALREAHRARALAQTPSGATLLEALPELTAGGAARPYLLYRHGAPDQHHGRLALRFLDEPAGGLAVAPLACERLHLAAGVGVCLQSHRKTLTTYEALVFDRRFRILNRQPLAGPPSRARLSADGRLAAVTVFVSGHSYASTSFTTRTSLLDTRSGQWVAEDLERFDVLRDGGPMRAADFNLWGVTFVGDGPRFFATLHTGGRFLLVEGDAGARRMRVLHDDVECPSLSPDGRRIAFKRRIPAAEAGRFAWQLRVLTLDGGRETALTAERHSVDDQVEWLDDRTLLYARPEDPTQPGAEEAVWALAADNGSPPRRLLRFASSPAAVR